MIHNLIRSAGLLVLIGGSLYGLSPRLWLCDNAADARRDAERHRRQQEEVRRQDQKKRNSSKKNRLAKKNGLIRIAKIFIDPAELGSFGSLGVKQEPFRGTDGDVSIFQPFGDPHYAPDGRLRQKPLSVSPLVRSFDHTSGGSSSLVYGLAT